MIGKVLFYNRLLREDFSVSPRLVSQGIYNEIHKSAKRGIKRNAKRAWIIPRQLKRRGLIGTWGKNKLLRKMIYG